MFSVAFKTGPTLEQVFAFVDALELFEVGYSWAGVRSLAVAYTIKPYEHRLVRLSVGLESTDDLIADLENGLAGVSTER